MKEKTYRANDVVSCVDEGEDGAMLYNPDTDESVLLNPSGLTIWNLLSAPRTVEEMANHLAATNPGLTIEQARKDAEQFIQSVIPDFVIEAPDEG